MNSYSSDDNRSFWRSHLNSMNWVKSLSRGTMEDEGASCVGRYNRQLNAMVKASQIAHQMAYKLVYEEQHEQEEEEEEDNVEFEVNQEFVEFYRESLKYKQEKQSVEKERLRQIAEGETVDYTVGEQVKSLARRTTIKPPTEMAGKKREEELAGFYGSHAKSIQLAETSMQMEFDRNLDIYSPVYWPSLPLKL